MKPRNSARPPFSRQAYVLLPIALLFFSGYLLIDRWGEALYYGDSNSYYLHVVSFWVNQDVGDYGATISSLQAANPGSPDPREDRFGIRLTKRGRRYIKYTLGVPIMETPFFWMAHLFAKRSPNYPADGWSSPYLLAVSLSTIVYLLLGFYLLGRVLCRHFSQRVTALVLLTLAFSTNVFYHATYVTMAHGFLFFDYCLLLYLTERYYGRPTPLKALGIGLIVGLIALTRVPEVISLLIPLLWGVRSWEELRQRWQFFRRRGSHLLLAGLGLLLAFSPQLGYWYYVSGQLYFNPYDGEGFDFLRPMVYKGWFDFSNGWLIYTPVMLLSLIGLFRLPKAAPGRLLPILAFVGLHVYIHYSYYAWTYFPGLGQRPMVETYPLLAFGLGACFEPVLRKRWPAFALLAALGFFTWLNLFQTWQMRKGIIWPERGNTAFYLETFGRLTPSWHSMVAFDTKERQPDTTTLQRRSTFYQAGFEQPGTPHRTTAAAHNGKASMQPPGHDYPLADSLELPSAAPGDWLRISLWAYVRAADQTWNRDEGVILFAELVDESGHRRKRRLMRPVSYIGNEAYSIWHAGRPDQWGEAAFFFRLPRRFEESWRLKLYLRNPAGQVVFLDDLRVGHYVP